MTLSYTTFLVAFVSACIGIVSWTALQIFRAVSALPSLEKGTVAFFHPFADGGGGGERVLWCAVKAIQESAPHAKILIYAHEGVTPQQLILDASERFNISLNMQLEVIPLKLTALILPESYPRLTLLRQAWGSVLLGYEALRLRVPEVFIDTTGWAFTFPMARLAGSKVACYVHYPTVSSDMIRRVASGQTSYNNKAGISSSPIKSTVKLVYYRVFALIYGLAGACSQVTMVNSTWTMGHISTLWWGHGAGRALLLWLLNFSPWNSSSQEEYGEEGAAISGSVFSQEQQQELGLSLVMPHGRLHLVYPPCDTTDLQRLPLDRSLKQLFLVSVAQFRPEKNHGLQLEAFAKAKKGAGDNLAGHALRVARLKLVGSCRNKDDEARLDRLKAYAVELGIENDTDWCINVSFSELKALLGGAVGGLHTMIDEHFGICVVEYMAAGVIPIAHNSGGPKSDIVVPMPLETSESKYTLSPEEDPSPDVCSDPDFLGYRQIETQHQITGFLAATIDEYAEAITKVLVMDQRDRLKISAAAQRHASKFSTERFMESFKAVIDPLLPKTD